MSFQSTTIEHEINNNGYSSKTDITKISVGTGCRGLTADSCGLTAPEYLTKMNILQKTIFQKLRIFQIFGQTIPTNICTEYLLVQGAVA